MDTDRRVGRQAGRQRCCQLFLSFNAAHRVSVSSFVSLRKCLTNEVQSLKVAFFQMTHSESAQLMY